MVLLTSVDVKGFASVTLEAVNLTAIIVQLEPEEGMDCLLAMGFMSARVCYTDSKCGEVAENKDCLNLADGVHDLTYANLQPFLSYCFTAEIYYTRDNGSSHTSIYSLGTGQTVQGIPTDMPHNLQISDNDVHLLVTWQPPPRSKWNGILTNYNASITISNGTIITAVLSSTTWTTPLIEPHLKSEVKVAACTRAGCGPAASQTTCKQFTSVMK